MVATPKKKRHRPTRDFVMAKRAKQNSAEAKAKKSKLDERINHETYFKITIPSIFFISLVESCFPVNELFFWKITPQGLTFQQSRLSFLYFEGFMDKKHFQYFQYNGNKTEKIVYFNGRNLKLALPNFVNADYVTIEPNDNWLSFRPSKKKLKIKSVNFFICRWENYGI